MSASLSVSVKETSYSIANNTSTVSITVKITTSGASYNQEGTAKLYVELNGSSKASGRTVTFGRNKTTTLFSKSYTITHNADGTKSVPWSVRLITGKDIKVEFDRPVALQIDGETILNVSSYHAVAAKKLAKVNE